ncbi:AraC family transcriptional regulator [Grimontia sp. NTOU-MAR1]|uniref:AraC family transcriptional regulator n=1 Tax=Grimontia sp. NTOU-MAR1 TaxID=3111011 RepID=UPI002DB78BC4|nr:AraC family transcriptional regulator [Grimontia sp. NTOU-MAR1]WRV98682.1 AraC family transcriptional regulator [Grimontia sp. NTOU-MAR1]
MENSLSIRAYTRKRQGHAHNYHQLVLPIKGTVQIELDNYSGAVIVGECIVIQAGTFHHFRANEAARFIVADMTELPHNITTPDFAVFSISAPFLSYLYFVEKQLENEVDKLLEEAIFSVFSCLLAQQKSNDVPDPRIRKVQAYIVEHLDTELSIQSLAAQACLSPTQFKKRFKEMLGISTFHYITLQRMEKAKALLTHTDLPVQIVSERVGYRDLSAFSRRFSTHFGMSPRVLAGNRE